MRALLVLVVAALPLVAVAGESNEVPEADGTTTRLLRMWDDTARFATEKVRRLGAEVRARSGPSVDLTLRAAPPNEAPEGELRWPVGIVNSRPGLTGASLALLENRIEGDARGAQLSLGMNRSGGGLLGGQLALVHNSVEGTLVGGQLSAGLNVANQGVVGGQVGLFNRAGGSSRGGQIAVANVADALAGGQVGASNVARELRGAQLGAFNLAGQVHGGQLSAVNVAGTLAGVQLGAVNVAGRAAGLQLGLVNVARSLDGVPLGLVNVIGDGALHVEAYGSDLQPLNVALKSGSRTFYTTLFAGAGRDRTFLYGLGAGVHRGDRLWFEADLDASSTHSYARPLPFADVMTQARLLGGVRIAKRVSVFAGPTANVRYAFEAGNAPATWSPWAKSWQAGKGAVQLWPGAVAGIRL